MKQLLHRISLFTTAAMLTLASYAQNVEYKGINYILDEESKTAFETAWAAAVEAKTALGTSENYEILLQAMYDYYYKD